MKKISFATVQLLLASAILVGNNPMASAAEVYSHLGTEGLGIGYGEGLSNAAGARGELNFGSFSRKLDRGDVTYDAKLKLSGAGLYGDWFVANGNFRLTTGLTYNDKEFSGVGRNASGTVTLNGVPYSVVGEALYAKVEYPRFMPYLGVGWGHNPNAKGWAMSADIGLLFGRPRVSLSATPVLAAQAGSDIEAERQSLQSDANSARVFPVFKVGVSYHF